jgi:hypothetical protein
MQISLQRSMIENSVGFVVLTAVTINDTIFWNVMPYSSIDIHRRFAGKYYFHIQGARVSQAGN